MNLEDIFLELDQERGSGPKLAFEQFLNTFGQGIKELRATFYDLKDPNGLSPQLSEDAAVERLIHFFNTQGEATFVLACHAALPPSLNPDLLQTIRASLPFMALNKEYKPQWEEAVRLLLSENFRLVEGKTYEMDLNTRRAFFRCLQLCFGESRIQELARILLSYYKDILADSSHSEYRLAKVHEITAYAFLDPERAVNELSTSYADLTGEENSPERMRLAALVASLAEQLQDHPELIQYAQSWQAEIQQDTAHLRASLAPLMEGGKASSDALMLPVPVEMFRQLRAEQIAENPSKEAKKRIEEALQTNASTLDLSHLGLLELPDEIKQLTSLQELILDGNPFLRVPDQVFQMRSLEQLSLAACGLRTVLNTNWPNLTELTSLSLQSNQLRWLSWELLGLVALLEINLEDNQFASLPYEWLESGKLLSLSGNPLPSAPIEGFDNLDQVSNQQQAPLDLGSGLLKRLDELKEIQEETEKGSRKMVQVLSWTGPNLNGFPMVERLTVRNSETLRNREGQDVIDPAYWLVNGIELGLPVDTVMHLQNVVHSIDEIGIQAFCGEGAIVLVDPLTFPQGDRYSIEPFISRLPKGLNLSVGVVVNDTKDNYLEDLLDLIKQRHKDTVTDIFLLDREDSLSLEILLDYAQKRSQDGLVGPGRGNYPALLDLLNRSDLISEKDVSSIDATSNEIGYRYLSEANLSTALVKRKFLRRVEGFHTNGTYYLSAMGMVKTFDQVTDALERPYMISLEDTSKVVEEFYSSPGMAPNLLDLFFQFSWISPIPQTRNLHFAYSKCVEHFQSDTTPSQVSDQASIKLTGYGELLPYRLKEMLIVNSLAQSPEINGLDMRSLEISYGPQSNIIYRFPPGQHEILVYCDNKSDQEKTLLSDTAVEAVTDSLKPLTAPGYLEWWCQPRWGESERQEMMLYYPTIRKIYLKSKNSYLQWDQWAWASNAYALGIKTDKQIIRSTRKTVLLYARDDFKQAFELIELLGAAEVSLLPYTPDLYHHLKHPYLGQMLDRIDQVILLFSDHFIESYQAMGYWKGLFDVQRGIGSNEIYRDGKPRKSLVDIRFKTIVISDFHGSTGLEKVREFWQKQADLPVPQIPVTADPFDPDSFPYHHKLLDSAKEILPRLDETFEWSKYLAFFRESDLKERNYEPLVELLPKDKSGKKSKGKGRSSNSGSLPPDTKS